MAESVRDAHFMLKDARDLLIARYKLSPPDVSTPLSAYTRNVHQMLNYGDRAQLDEADLAVISEQSALAFSSAESDVNLRRKRRQPAQLAWQDPHILDTGVNGPDVQASGVGA
ncbi:hypothetical protein FA95DRAFT_1576591 [Auriscalpium vulgare]|uniref:Uncharacterized protein n=1 Tax=Auriscalpium vulgare TaxID=40419 RepID=A0ACB8RA75_9AGAM|nr:hypothetical protein FA95DRAFT_1576591 [Auriscalpium vulgare]